MEVQIQLIHLEAGGAEAVGQQAFGNAQAEVAQRKRYLRLIDGTTWSVNKERVSCFEFNPPFLFC